MKSEHERWISVNDRYPEKGQEVSVLLSGNVVRIALHTAFIPICGTELVHLFEGDICHVEGWEYQGRAFRNVTHWQPLLEPPTNN